MARTSNLTDFLDDVASAIKTKKGYQSSQKIAASNFDTEIASIDTLNGEEITITPTTSQQIVTPRQGKNAITQVTVSAVTSNIDANITQSNIKRGVTILGVEGNLDSDKPDQTKTVTPTTSQQVITPDTGYELASVTVGAVTNTIDADIQPGNIKKNVSILGVLGTYEGQQINNQDKTVNPTTSQQVIGADTGYTGLGQVTVTGVNSSIDMNIQANNIRKDVTILGVTGTVEAGLDTSDATATVYDIVDGMTAYVNGVKLTGQVNRWSDANIINAVNIKPNIISGEVVFEGVPTVGVNNNDKQYLDMNSVVSISGSNANIATAINLIPNVLKEGVTILGVTGNLSPTGENLENVIAEQENIIMNLRNIVNNKSGIMMTIPDEDFANTSFSYSSFNTLPNWLINSNWSQVNNMMGKFAYCYNLTNIPNFDTSNVTVMSGAFNSCTNLTSVPNFNTSNVRMMIATFGNCTNLTSVPNFDTSNVTGMASTFYNCVNLTSVPNFNTSKVTSMVSTFQYCRNLTSVPNFFIPNVTSMTRMFADCQNLSTVSLDGDSLKSADYAFMNCFSLTNIPDINYMSITNALGMFQNCYNLTNVNDVMVSNVTTFSRTFFGCNNLSNDSIQNIVNMCINATNIPSSHRNINNANIYSPLQGTKFDSSYYQDRLTDLTNAGWRY